MKYFYGSNKRTEKFWKNGSNYLNFKCIPNLMVFSSINGEDSEIVSKLSLWERGHEDSTADNGWFKSNTNQKCVYSKLFIISEEETNSLLKYKRGDRHQRRCINGGGTSHLQSTEDSFGTRFHATAGHGLSRKTWGQSLLWYLSRSLLVEYRSRWNVNGEKRFCIKINQKVPF